MATKNLTKKFHDARKAAKANRSLNINSKGDDEDKAESGLLNVIFFEYDKTFLFQFNGFILILLFIFRAKKD